MSGMDSFELQYKTLEKIGEGSFSEVLKIEEKSTGKMFAAKKLKKHYRHELCMGNCAEIKAAKKVKYHPNVLNMLEYHYNSFSGRLMFVFELMDLSLYDYFKTRKRGMSETKVKNYLFQILKGLEHLHTSGLFHRDVKPENILIRFPLFEDGETDLPKVDLIKLADLGSARGIYSSPPYTEYISTRWYRSPECLLTNGNYGPKMDIWATGCVFYEMITSHPLFPGSNELDQLARIHAVLGTPTIQLLSRLKSKSKNCIFFPKQRGCGIDCLLPNISRHGRSILQLMIEYDADKRINVKRLLRNLYFDSARELLEPTNRKRVQKKPPFQPTKIPRFIRRSAGDQVSNHSSGSSKMSKDGSLDRVKRSSHTTSNKSTDSSNKRRVKTPSIEIPYYSSINSKEKSLTLVDFKIGRSMEEARGRARVEQPDKTALRKNLELILNSKDSEAPKNFRKASSRDKQFLSKSMVLTKKREDAKLEESLGKPGQQISHTRRFKNLNEFVYQIRK